MPIIVICMHFASASHFSFWLLIVAHLVMSPPRPPNGEALIVVATMLMIMTMTTTTAIISIRPRMRETLPMHAAFFDLWHACMHPLMLGTSAVGKGGGGRRKQRLE